MVGAGDEQRISQALMTRASGSEQKNHTLQTLALNEVRLDYQIAGYCLPGRMP
jgi:hypothetical protein